MNTTQSEEYDEYVRRKVWRPFLTDSSRNYEEVEYCEGYEYKVGKLLESTDDKANKSIRSTED